MSAGLDAQHATIRSLQQSFDDELEDLRNTVRIQTAELRDLKRTVDNLQSSAACKRHCSRHSATVGQLLQSFKAALDVVVMIIDNDNDGDSYASVEEAASPSLLETGPVVQPSASSSRQNAPHHNHALTTSDQDAIIQDRLRKIAAMVAQEKRQRGEAEQPMPSAPECRLIPRPNTLDQLWHEWFYGGEDGSPSIAQLNSWFGSTWRSENPQLYKWKKDIVYSILKSIPPHAPVDKEAVDKALAHAREQIDIMGSIDKYFRSLPKGPSKRFPNKKK